MSHRRPKERQCHVCGVVFRDSEYGYWIMETIRECYSLTNNPYMCSKCARKADSFVNYYGKKKKEDKERLRVFLVSGYQCSKDFYSLMNGGYF